MPRPHRPLSCTRTLPALLALLAPAPGIHATPTTPLQRRGGGQNPVTDDPNSIPTTPPTSNYNNGVPKIAGSEGGFIGLVVGLGILLICASLGVWYLLRRRRRQREKRQSDAPGARGLAPYETKTSFPKPKGGLFGGKNRQSRGWVKTGDGEFGEARMGEGEGIELAGGRKGQGPYLASDAQGAFSSASTVRLAPPEEGGGGWKDPYSPSASREELVSPVGVPSPTGFGEEREGEYERVQGGQREVHERGEGAGSPESRRSESGRFAGGTRFRESL